MLKSKEETPYVKNSEIGRLSDNSAGASHFSVSTDYSLEEALEPNFFKMGHNAGMRKNDTIFLVTGQHRQEVTHAKLAVVAARANCVEVRQLGEAHTVAVGEMTCFQTLGVKPSANAIEIENSFRALALRLHPDKPGGDKKQMQLINKARSECLLIAENRDMAA